MIAGLAKFQHHVEIIENRQQFTASLMLASFHCPKGRATQLLTETQRRKVRHLRGLAP
jgi:hypothetical protein